MQPLLGYLLPQGAHYLSDNLLAIQTTLSIRLHFLRRAGISPSAQEDPQEKTNVSSSNLQPHLAAKATIFRLLWTVICVCLG